MGNTKMIAVCNISTIFLATIIILQSNGTFADKIENVTEDSSKELETSLFQLREDYQTGLAQVIQFFYGINSTISTLNSRQTNLETFLSSLDTAVKEIENKLTASVSKLSTRLRDLEKFADIGKWAENFINFNKSAVWAGHEEGYGDAHVCRIFKDTEIIPGKYYASVNFCFVVADGSEFKQKNCEILRACKPDKYRWIPSINSVVPSGAVIGGKDKSNETYYICRGNIEDGSRSIPNMILPGKFQASQGTCFIPYGGVKVGANIEILVEKDPNFCN